MSHIAARMTPVRVPYRSTASRALGEQLASACRDRQDAPALEVGAWVVDWTGPEDDAFDEPGNWTVMIGYQAPVFPGCPDPAQPAWMYLHLALRSPDEVGEAARRVLDGGLSVDRLMGATQRTWSPVTPGCR